LPQRQRERERERERGDWVTNSRETLDASKERQGVSSILVDMLLGAVAAAPSAGAPRGCVAGEALSLRRVRRRAFPDLTTTLRRRMETCAFGENARGRGNDGVEATLASSSATHGRGDGDGDVGTLEKDFLATLRQHYGEAPLLSLDLSEGEWASGGAAGSSSRGTVLQEPQVCGFQNTFSCSLGLRYEVGDEVARGAFGTVHSALDKVSGEEVAIKTMKKNKLGQDSYVAEGIKAEIDILGLVQGCEGVIELFDVQEDRHNLHVVTELLKGGTLWDVMEKGEMDEQTAKPVIRQILTMVRDIHAVGVVHRDLKPKNFMFDVDPVDLGAARVVGLDFGTASVIPEQGLMTASVGTPTYMAPEVADQQKRGYTELCDLWSVGVILYQALAGGERVPFQHIWDQIAHTNAAVSGLVSVQSILDTMAAIDDALNAYDCDTMALLFPPGTIPTADSFSPELRDFLCRLLCPESKRMSAVEALQHPWLA